jgi:para-aminobenzoate synthetase/4-amino-4-deoxychorismate lyase
MHEPFELYEAILWEPGTGYFLLDSHMDRLERSATHFGFECDVGRIRAELDAFSGQLASTPRKLRLELSANGALKLEHTDVKSSTTVQVALAPSPVDSSDVFLRHKTSRREVFARALAARPSAQDVILWNERGELTETCSANLVLELEGRRVTPPLSCGLLPGTFRAHLLARGELVEELLPVAALERASALYLVNSVRKWCELRLLQAA